MPYMNVIPPGLDFSNLKVDLPEDPVVKEMLQHKPAYGGVTPKAASQDSPKSTGKGTPKGGEGRHSKCGFRYFRSCMASWQSVCSCVADPVSSL